MTDIDRSKFLEAYIQKFAHAHGLDSEETVTLFELVFQQICILDELPVNRESFVHPKNFSKSVQAAYSEWSASLQAS